MFYNLKKRLDALNTASGFSVIFACIAATLLMIFSENTLLKGDYYLGMNMAKTAVNIFAEGVFLGLSGEFLHTLIDRRGK